MNFRFYTYCMYVVFYVKKKRREKNGRARRPGAHSDWVVSSAPTVRYRLSQSTHSERLARPFDSSLLAARTFCVFLSSGIEPVWRWFGLCNMFANKTASVQQQLPNGPSAGLDLPFDYHRAHPTTDEPSLIGGTTTGSRLDPYQQACFYPQQHNLPYNPPAQPSPRTSAGQHQQQQINSGGGRLDLRNLLLAPPATAAGRGLRDGRGSISAPATPVDDSSSLAAAAVAAAVVPLNFNVSSSGGGGGGKNSSSGGGGGIGKFMMKKVNSSGGGVSGSAQYDCVLRDLIHPAHADALKAHSALAMKLLKTGKNHLIFCLSLK